MKTSTKAAILAPIFAATSLFAGASAYAQDNPKNSPSVKTEQTGSSPQDSYGRNPIVTYNKGGVNLASEIISVPIYPNHEKITFSDLGLTGGNVTKTWAEDAEAMSKKYVSYVNKTYGEGLEKNSTLAKYQILSEKLKEELKFEKKYPNYPEAFREITMSASDGVFTSEELNKIYQLIKNDGPLTISLAKAGLEKDGKPYSFSGNYEFIPVNPAGEKPGKLEQKAQASKTESGQDEKTQAHMKSKSKETHGYPRNPAEVSDESRARTAAEGTPAYQHEKEKAEAKAKQGKPNKLESEVQTIAAKTSPEKFNPALSLVLGADYSTYNNTAGATIGLKFGYSDNPVNLSFNVGYSRWLSPTSSETPTPDLGPGFSGKITSKDSNGYSVSLGNSLYFGGKDFKVVVGGNVSMKYSWNHDTSTSTYLKGNLFSGPDADPTETLSGTEYALYGGLQYKGIELDAGASFSPSRKPVPYFSARVTLGQTESKN